MFLFLNNIENRCFFAWGSGMFVQLFSLTKMKLAVFFSAFSQPLSTMLWSRAVVSRAGYNSAQLYPDRDALEFSKGLVTKNQSPCLV